MSDGPLPTGWKRHGLPLAVICLGTFIGTSFYLVAPARARREIQRLAAPAPAALPAAATPAPEPEPEVAPTALYEGSQEVAVLMYHDVVDRPVVYHDIRTPDFRAQMQQLKASGANVIPLAALYDHLRHGKQLPPRSVVLTFDDGYLGQYENAYPILKKFGFPATFFVHTSVVGVKTGKDHITWEQLQALDKEGLISIECHTVNHPEDLRKCDDAQLDRELHESKKRLEEKLERTIRFLAYPVGNANGRVARVAHEAGYEMAFTMGPGWAGSPADAFFVPRLLPKRIPEICAKWDAAGELSRFRPHVLEIRSTDLEQGSLEDRLVHLRWVRGGRLSGARILGRRNVPTLVKAAAASAGLNGTFFSDARVNSDGAGIVGPIVSRYGPGFAPGLPGDRDRIAGRPFVVISPEKIAFMPFRPNLAYDADGVERLLPGATDCFVAGAWLVHRGVPATREELESFRLDNVFDFRPRAFMGIDREGKLFLGASSTSNESDRLAITLAEMGLEECVLLDSGFSTSLVLGSEVLVTGIRRVGMPARPVPHFLLLHAVDPEKGSEVMASRYYPEAFVGPRETPLVPVLEKQFADGSVAFAADESTAADPPRRRRRRRR